MIRSQIFALMSSENVGGAEKLKSQPWYAIGKIKSEWAEQITPHIDIDKNKSPSFCYFRDKIRELI